MEWNDEQLHQLRNQAAMQVLAEIRALPTGTHVPVPWFLDVDGVLNVDGGVPSSPNDWPDYRREAVPTSESYALAVRWSPQLIDCINELEARRHIDIVWLTTWEDDAKRFLAPALGLPRRGRVILGGASKSGWWKFDAIQAHLDQPDPQFFIWTDDEIFEHSCASWLYRTMPLDQGLILVPSENQGLTPNHLQTIVRALAHRARG